MGRDRERIIWITTILIMAFGLMALYSASFENVRVSQRVFFDQMLCAGLGLLLMWGLSRMDYRRFFDMAYVVYGINVVLLLLVLILGRHILGARRWLEIGSINFQPSELAKVTLILVLARYFCQQHPTHRFNLRGRFEALSKELLWPLALSAVSMILIFKQPDLGSAILLFGIFLAMLFYSGIRPKYFFSFLSFCLLLAPFLWKLMKPYQKDRLLVFLNPNIDPLGAGYTIIQSKIAVGSGRLFGKGWLSGTQNQLNFLPERHTDFIFSVIGEEWGFVGGSLLIVCFFLLIQSGLRIIQQTKDKFGALLAVGVVTILTLQVTINIGMVLGLFPIVGITLPFVSYGRSSFLVFAIMVGILLNLNRRQSAV